ncbi:unnamed protein product [Prorocentrum cordatum]|uniref:Uncharacterized protein n=1 Tax=Prorocentrum cordatum TaxID=2364126 RepID=A0ABN9PL97_9DINO|nr:unnamed protein product [Polarella glacialis]
MRIIMAKLAWTVLVGIVVAFPVMLGGVLWEERIPMRMAVKMVAPHPLPMALILSSDRGAGRTEPWRGVGGVALMPVFDCNRGDLPPPRGAAPWHGGGWSLAFGCACRSGMVAPTGVPPPPFLPEAADRGEPTAHVGSLVAALLPAFEALPVFPWPCAGVRHPGCRTCAS